MDEKDNKTNLELLELRRKYLGKRFCIYRGKYRGNIGKCRWIESKSIEVSGKIITSIWYRIDVQESNGYYFPKTKSYWAMEDQIIRIQDEPDEVPYYSGW